MVAGRAASIPAGVGLGRARGGMAEMEEEKRKAWAHGIGTGVAWMAGAALAAWLCSASALLDLSWRKEERRGRGKRIGFREWIRPARAEGEVRRCTRRVESPALLPVAAWAAVRAQ